MPNEFQKQLEKDAKRHILDLILSNTDSSVILKLTESYKALTDSIPNYDWCPKGPCDTDCEGSDNVAVGYSTLSDTTTGCASGPIGMTPPSECLTVEPTPEPFTSEPKKRKPRTPKTPEPEPEQLELPLNPADTTEVATKEAPAAAEEGMSKEEYAERQQDARNLFLSKIQAASAVSDEAGKATRAKATALMGTYGAARVSEVPAGNIEEFLTKLSAI